MKTSMMALLIILAAFTVQSGQTNFAACTIAKQGDRIYITWCNLPPGKPVQVQWVEHLADFDCPPKVHKQYLPPLPPGFNPRYSYPINDRTKFFRLYWP